MTTRTILLVTLERLLSLEQIQELFTELVIVLKFGNLSESNMLTDIKNFLALCNFLNFKVAVNLNSVQ